MGLLLFLFWLVLNGRLSFDVIVTGIIASALVLVFMCRFGKWSFQKERLVFLLFPRAAWFAVSLLWEIIKANLSVLMIICRGNADPCIRTIKTGLKTKFGRVMLANAITLTPGTVSVQMLNDRIIVHCLTDKLANELGDMKLEKQLKKMEVLALGERV